MSKTEKRLGEQVNREVVQRGYGWIVNEAAERAIDGRRVIGHNDIAFTVFPTGPDRADFFCSLRETAAKVVDEQHPDFTQTREMLHETRALDEIPVLIYTDDEGLMCLIVRVDTGLSGTQGVLN